VARAATPALPATPVLIMGSDRDEGAVEAARANARRAGVAEHVTLQCRPFSAIEPPALAGWVVTNPPYGLRTGPPGRRPERGWRGRSPLRGLYAALGDVLRARCPGWSVAVLCPDEELVYATGLSFDPARALHTLNGGLRVTLWQGRTPPVARAAR
jgi:putative N6-adenine-specific DNA methylase